VTRISNDIPRREVRRLWQFSVLFASTSALILGCGPSFDESGRQEIYIHVTEDGFVPRRSVVPADRPVTLVVTRDTDATCAKEIVIEGNPEGVSLPLNQEVRIPIDAGIHDSLTYMCGMEMYSGVVVAK
jgi:plastocyanin domain-containing protein